MALHGVGGKQGSPGRVVSRSTEVEESMIRPSKSWVPLLITVCLITTMTSGCFRKKVRPTGATEKLLEYLNENKAPRPEPAKTIGSLWDERAAYLVSDFKARMPGDIVTVIVRESTNAVAAATADSARDSQQSSGIPFLGGAERRIKELPNLSSGKGNSTFSGKGSTTRQSTLTATLTAQVRQVLPNGNLIIEGFRDIRIHGENQSLSLSGIVRPRDITRDNQVLSSSIAFMEVKLQGKGMVTDNLKPGWLFRLLRHIAPF